MVRTVQALAGVGQDGYARHSGSNDAAQGLYRAHGFRLAGLRRGYYQDPPEDALLMTAPGERALAAARGGIAAG